MAKFMNLVRCKVKASHREEYLKKMDERQKFDGMISTKVVEVKPNEFFMIGEWNSEDNIAKARPKMIEFYHCIQELDDVCVDGHAYSIWLGSRVVLAKVPSIGVKLRRTIKADYRAAAETLGISPYELQAVTWCAWRRVLTTKCS